MGDWSGTGYMVLDPDTYTGQYMVDGGLTGSLNGGVTSEQVNVAMLVNTIMAIEDIISTYLLCNFLVSVLPLGGPIGVLSIAAVVFITYKLLSMTVCYYMEAVELAERYYEDGDWLAGSDLIDQTELDVAFSIGGWVIGIAGNTALTKRVTESLTEIIGEKAAKKLVKGTKIPTDMKKYVEELIERGFTEDAVRIMAETLEPQSIEKLGRLSKKGLSRRFLECLAENESILKKFDEGQLLLFENSTADPETIIRHLAEEGEDFISRFVKHGDEVFEGDWETSWVDFMSPGDAAKYNRWVELREAELDQKVINDILLTNKGYRPEPITYLSKEYIDAHLEMFSDGVTKISKATPSGQAGPPGGTFVMPKFVADEIIQEANGDVAKLEKLLSLEPGTLGDSPVRLDIDEPNGLRMPNGNELGANEQWIPGGETAGGIPEATIDSPLPGEYVSTPIFE